MRKFMVVFVISAIFLAGCGANNVVEKKDAPQVTKNNSEIDTSQETTTDLNKDLVPISTKTFDGIWKLTTYQNPDSVKKITEWKPKPLDYKGELQKKWSNTISYRKHDKSCRSLIVQPYRDYPNGWGFYSCHMYIGNEDFSGIVEPETGKFHYYYCLLGMSDGENIYTDDALFVSGMVCYRIRDMKRIWIGSNCSGGICMDKGFISGNSLIAIDNDRLDNDSICRVNPNTGQNVWELECANPKGKEDEVIISSTYSYNDKYLLIYTIRRYPNPAIEYANILKTTSYYLVNTYDGSVVKANIDLNLNIQEMVSTKDDFILNINHGKAVIFNTKDMKCEEIEISQMLNIRESEDNNFTIQIITGNKLLITNRYNSKSNYYILDLQTKNYMKLKFKLCLIINEELIAHENNQITRIDPETFCPIWIIKNVHGLVEIVDWRGVLVVSDNELACYNAIK